MPAPNIFELYKVDTYIMSASLNVLNNAGISDVFTLRGNQNLPTPRVELISATGNPLGHVFVSGSKGYYDSWNVTLNATVVTDRAETPSMHDTYFSKVAALLADYSTYNSGSNLPYHTVYRADFSGASPTVQTEDNQDISTLSFVLSVFVKPEAWL